jgi:hypothetical protein
MDALLAQTVDRGAFQEMMAQIHGVKPGAANAPPSPPAVGAPPAAGAPPAGTAAAGAAAPAAPVARPAMPEFAARSRRPVVPQPGAKPASRAAHHLGFKRVMRFPTLLVAALCVLVGTGCLVVVALALLKDQVVKAPDAVKEPEIVKDAQGELWAIPRGWAAVPHDDGTMWSKTEGGQEEPARKIVRDTAGRAWAVPAGKETKESKTGKLFYVDDSGYEVMAEPADDWLNIQDQMDKIKDYKTGHVHGYIWFGVGLLAVGLALAALGLWMWSDVRQVEREKAAEVLRQLPGADSQAGVPRPVRAVLPPITDALPAEEAAKAPAPAVPPASSAPSPAAPSEPPPAGDRPKPE